MGGYGALFAVNMYLTYTAYVSFSFMFLSTLQQLAALVKILLIFMVSKSLKYDTDFLNSLMLLILVKSLKLDNCRSI